MSEVTRILTAIERGDARSTDELLPVVYHELRRMAAHKMTSEPAGHTLHSLRSSMRRGFNSWTLRTNPGRTARISSALPPKRCDAS